MQHRRACRAELWDAGPVRVLLQVEDPWAFADWPRWPSGQAFICDGAGVYEAGDEEETALGALPAAALPADRVAPLPVRTGPGAVAFDADGAGLAPRVVRELWSTAPGRRCCSPVTSRSPGGPATWGHRQTCLP